MCATPSAKRRCRASSSTEGGWLHVSKTDDDARRGLTPTLLAGEFGAAVEHWPAERVREELKSAALFQAVSTIRAAFTIHPLNYALGLAAAAEAAGVRIFEDTPALEIDPAGVRKRIVTPSARVRASQSCSPATSHLARADAADSPARCCRSRPTSSSPSRSATSLHDAINYPRRGQRHRARRTIIIASSTATG